MVKRYEICEQNGNGYEIEDGDWVKYEDYEKLKIEMLQEWEAKGILLEENTKLKKENKKLKKENKYLEDLSIT